MFNFLIEIWQICALQISEHLNQQIDALQKQIGRNNRRIVYILRKVDELIQQVELKNRQARSILHGNPDQDMVLMAEDMAADADHILLEAMALNVKADKLKKASEVAGEQVHKLLAFQSKRNLDMDWMFLLFSWIWQMEYFSVSDTINHGTWH